MDSQPHAPYIIHSDGSVLQGESIGPDQLAWEYHPSDLTFIRIDHQSCELHLNPEKDQRSSQCSMSSPSKLPWNRSKQKEEWLRGGRSASMASHGTT